jgi:hypothetical protein
VEQVHLVGTFIVYLSTSTERQQSKFTLTPNLLTSTIVALQYWKAH